MDREPNRRRPRRRVVRGLRDAAFVALLVVSAAAEWRPARPAQAAESGDLMVIIDNLRSSAGRVRVALWKGPEGFTTPEAVVAKRGVASRTGAVQVVFPRLAPGRYALAGFHDENDNGELDRTWIGWPEEGLGFSNGAWISLAGAPSFKAAMIEVAPGAQSTVISLRYPRHRDRGRPRAGQEAVAPNKYFHRPGQVVIITTNAQP